jgi:hypothetical protein
MGENDVAVSSITAVPAVTQPLPRVSFFTEVGREGPDKTEMKQTFVVRVPKTGSEIA